MNISEWDLVWGEPTSYWHIYDRDTGTSLCGRYYALPGFLDNKTQVTEDDEYREGRDCKTCCRKAGFVE